MRKDPVTAKVAHRRGGAPQVGSLVRRIGAATRGTDGGVAPAPDDDGPVPSPAPATETATRVGTRLLAGLCLAFAAAGLTAPSAAAAAALRPVVSAVWPATVSTGGTTVTVTGRGFTDTRSVSLLSPPTASVIARPVSAAYTVVSDSTLRLSVPAHEAGAVWIKVTTEDGSSVYSSADQLQYTQTDASSPSAAAPGKDALGALLLAMVIGMVAGRSKS